MLNKTKNDPKRGAQNLLKNCAFVSSGDSLLIAYEPDSFGHFSRDVLFDIETEALALGLHVKKIDVGFAPDLTDLPDYLLDQIAQTDIVVFLSRCGDQLRFSEMPLGPKFIVCFAYNSYLLGSAFGTADYRAFCEAKRAVDRMLFSGSEVTLSCPAGTHVTGHVDAATIKPSDTTSMRFPMSVFSPVPAKTFSGQVALSGFLTGTGSHYYSDYTVAFDEQVLAMFEAGRLTGFSGSGNDVCKANRHYDEVAKAFSLDREFVHSWHAGIHPGCGFPWDMWENDKRWGCVAFGNPRLLHFHTCGAYAPGEISWNVVDPTIEVDGVKLWEDGRFCLERLEEGPEILSRYPCAAQAFAEPDRNIGLFW